MLSRFRLPRIIVAVHLAALLCAGYLLAHYSIATVFSWSALYWLVLCLVAHYSVLRTVGRGVPHNISVGFSVAGAIVVMFNPLVSACLIALGTLDERDIKRKRAWRDSLGNRSMFFVCGTVASLAYQQVARLGNPRDSTFLLVCIGVVVAAYFIVNSAIVHLVVSSLNGEPFFRNYPFKGDLLLGYSFQGLLAMALVVVARQHPALAILVVGPLWGVRFSLEKIIELRELNQQLVQSFADALDMRDHDTAGHTRRVATLARLIGRELGLSNRRLDAIYAAGSLHDLGKIGIPDSILLKPGRLERDEWDEMRKHPVLGASLLAPYRHLQEVTAIMRHHHERFDGDGYPDGLAGEDIPMGARVIAVADTFMVITDGRQYRAARSVPEAIAEIRRCSGSQFDPRIVAAFLALEPVAVLEAVHSADISDAAPVLRALSPTPTWQKVLGFNAA